MLDFLNKPLATPTGSLVRGLHALLVLACFGAWATSEVHGLASLHRACGYTAMVAWSARLLATCRMRGKSSTRRWPSS